MNRGEIWWAELGEPFGSGPGYRRPIVVVQSNAFNASGISTVVVAALTSDVRLAQAPGNILLTAAMSGLDKPSVINVSQLLTIDKDFLTEYVNHLDAATVAMIDEGLRLVLAV